MHSRGLPRVAPAASSSGIPNIGARRSALAVFPMPLVSPSLLKLRVSRKELLQGRMHIPFMPLCATVTMKVTGNTRHFLFPTIDQNPFLPQAPGKPGLLYRANDAKKWRDGVQAVFVQRRSAVYEYVGEYELTRAPSLSVVEYMTWPSKVGRCTPPHGTWMLMLRGSGEDGVGGCHLRQGKIYGHMGKGHPSRPVRPGTNPARGAEGDHRTKGAEEGRRGSAHPDHSECRRRREDS